MNDLENLFSSLENELSGSQRKINISSAIGVYYGLSKEGYLRLSFMSSEPVSKLESTKLLRVIQGNENNKYFWTCFDLMKPEARRVFLAFGSNLIDSVEGIKDEAKALHSLKKRYITWKSLFKNEPINNISVEKLQGLYGELYFLKKYMLDSYGAEKAIQAWSGPEGYSKDFSVDDSWYEIKTVGANTASVKISSLAQLSSTHDGHLVIIRAEKMADSFDNGEASIEELFREIDSAIEDELVEELFFRKLSTLEIDLADKSLSTKFDVK